MGTTEVVVEGRDVVEVDVVIGFEVDEVEADFEVEEEALGDVEVAVVGLGTIAIDVDDVFEVDREDFVDEDDLDGDGEVVVEDRLVVELETEVVVVVDAAKGRVDVEDVVDDEVVVVVETVVVVVVDVVVERVDVGDVVDVVLVVAVGVGRVVVLDKVVDDAEVEESADGVEVGDGLTTASLRNRFILYEPPHRTLVSPPHLEMHPSAAGSSLAVLPQKHCVPYSKPA
jgi:hypothetical protein